MVRKVFALALVGLLALPVSAFADEKSPSAPKAASSSTKKKVIWTIVGASAGFVGGIALGLALHDDSINSDRKAWTTVAICTGLGGFAGAMVGRLNTGGGVKVERSATPVRSDSLGISWESAIGKAPHAR